MAIFRQQRSNAAQRIARKLREEREGGTVAQSDTTERPRRGARTEILRRPSVGPYDHSVVERFGAAVAPLRPETAITALGYYPVTLKRWRERNNMPRHFRLLVAFLESAPREVWPKEITDVLDVFEKNKGYKD